LIKSKLRKIYLARQKLLSDAERREKSFRVGEIFFANLDLSEVRRLHIFLSVDEQNEIDTSFFINELWGNYINIKTVVPRVNIERDELEHLEFSSESTLHVSSWGIPEPTGNELIGERKIDMVLVPMLCFDERGFRVGHGKGYYDKFLSLCREDCVKIGLSMFEPVEEIEDIQAHDVMLDYCVTPRKVWNFSLMVETRM